MAPRELKGKKWGKSCVVSSPVLSSVDASLVSSPLSLPPSLYRAGSQLRLLLSV